MPQEMTEPNPFPGTGGAYLGLSWGLHEEGIEVVVKAPEKMVLRQQQLKLQEPV